MRHLYRILLLCAGSIVLLGWVVKHTEPSTNVGLRQIAQAQQIERGGWTEALFQGIDHPLHPLGIAAVHRIFDGAGPASWQRAALLLSFGAAILLVIPIYLVALELFGENAAWLAAALVTINPSTGFIVVNVSSETSFLVWWSFGLWASLRFLRAGQFFWLPLAIGFGALAYLTRPEGMLLPVALALTLLVLPLQMSTRINWPRWWGALMCVIGGLVLFSGPYIAIKGGLGTKPGIARVLGLQPESPPDALERERPLPPGQTSLETYAQASVRMLKAHRAALTYPLVPFAIVGVILAVRMRERARTWLFLGIILAASGVALVRLYATGGYLTARHALIPGLILTLAAAFGLVWLTDKVSLPGRRLGMNSERIRPGPAVWAALIAALVVVSDLRTLGPLRTGPFSAYYSAGHWLARNTRPTEQVLDLTDWSLFFSERPGYHFADVYRAPRDPKTRWIVVRRPHIDGHWHYSEVVRELIGGREAVALVPPQPGPNEMQICIYDRLSPPALAASIPQSDTRNSKY
jgi:4-amino-4-deoxy-L-arabinose transferase-like glycosyltransferase